MKYSCEILHSFQIIFFSKRENLFTKGYEFKAWIITHYFTIGLIKGKRKRIHMINETHEFIIGQSLQKYAWMIDQIFWGKFSLFMMLLWNNNHGLRKFIYSKIWTKCMYFYVPEIFSQDYFRVLIVQPNQ